MVPHKYIISGDTISLWHQLIHLHRGQHYRFDISHTVSSQHNKSNNHNGHLHITNSCKIVQVQLGKI